MRFILFMWIAEMVIALDRALWRLRLLTATVFYVISTPFLLRWYRWRIDREDRKLRKTYRDFNW